jgi:bacterial leucyl aminopeptidase
MFIQVILLSLVSSFAVANVKKFVTVDAQIYSQVEKSQKSLLTKDGITLVQLTEEEITQLSDKIHHELKRCGGFVAHDSEAEARAVFENKSARLWGSKGVLNQYQIDQQSTVNPALKLVQETNIRETIKKMSSYHNRYYKAETGKESQSFLKDKWAALIKNRSDASVEYFQHSSWGQPSIILTITGSELPNEIVVLGGHADSIGGMFGGSGAKAPGADDNASGIATITETIRVLMEIGFQPKRTLKFMAYAAEEAGLLGSKEIAAQFKAQGKNVVGKMQLDMTNFKGSASLDIALMSDYTNRAQNEFVGKIIDEYVKVPWGYSKCGYGCSDHASWHNNGYPASMPFEATMQEMNKDIHTANDVIEKSNGNADHAFKFAQMATAFMIELAN